MTNGVFGVLRRGRLFLSVAAIVGLAVFLLPSAAAQGSGKGKLSTEVENIVREAAPDDLVRVIVQTHERASSAHFTRLHGRGGAVKRQHGSIRGYTANLPASQIEAFADDPEIERISHDSPVTAQLDVAYQAVRADVAFVDSGGLDGSGIGIAVVDTGVYPHEDLLRPKDAPQVVEVEIVGSESGLADYYGHGTHVAGIIAGNGAASSDRYSYRTFAGLAPGARIISLRAMAPDGTGYASDVIASLDWAIQHKDEYNIRVMNLSLGHPVYESYTTDPVCRAVRAATDAGIVVVVAAGNDGGVGTGYGTITSPGHEPSAITVGAMDDGNTVTTTDDVLAWYSSKGPTLIDFVVKPDLVAPGTWVVSARAEGSYLDETYHGFTLATDDYKDEPGYAEKDGDYFVLAGTSMAAPMAAATAALMLQQDPTLNPATVKARLMSSAVKDDRVIFDTGAGYLDVAAALEATGYAEAAPSPHASVSPSGKIEIEDLGLVWGGERYWSFGLVWGSSEFRYFSLDASVVENSDVTASGLVWSGGRSILMSTTGSVDILGAVWGGGGGGGGGGGTCRRCQ